MNVSPELLMRYYDGEVSPDEAETVEAALEKDPELAERLSAFDQVGDFVRALSHERMSKDVNVADAVMRKIATQAATVPPASKVVHLKAARRWAAFLPAAAGALTLAAAVV